MTREARFAEGEPQPCEWFATCENNTLMVADHPTLGELRICGRCAEVVGIVNPVATDKYCYECTQEGTFLFGEWYQLVIHDPDDGINTTVRAKLCPIHYEEADREDLVLDIRRLT